MQNNESFLQNLKILKAPDSRYMIETVSSLTKKLEQ